MRMLAGPAAPQPVWKKRRNPARSTPRHPMPCSLPRRSDPPAQTRSPRRLTVGGGGCRSEARLPGEGPQVGRWSRRDSRRCHAGWPTAEVGTALGGRGRGRSLLTASQPRAVRREGLTGQMGHTAQGTWLGPSAPAAACLASGGVPHLHQTLPRKSGGGGRPEESKIAPNCSASHIDHISFMVRAHLGLV